MNFFSYGLVLACLIDLSIISYCPVANAEEYSEQETYELIIRNGIIGASIGAVIALNLRAHEIINYFVIPNQIINLFVPNMQDGRNQIRTIIILWTGPIISSVILVAKTCLVGGALGALTVIFLTIAIESMR